MLRDQYMLNKSSSFFARMSFDKGNTKNILLLKKNKFLVPKLKHKASFFDIFWIKRF